MSNPFLEKIEPHLISEELIIQEFVLHALNEYPNTPAEWTNRVLEKAIQSEKDRSSLLIWAKKDALNEDSVPLLLKLLEVIEPARKHLVMHLINELKPEIIVAFEKELSPYLEKEFFTFNCFLLEGEEENLWEEYGSVLASLEEKQFFDQDLFLRAKKILHILVLQGSYDEVEIDAIMQEELKAPWFSFNGILAVRAIGLLKLEKYIPVLAGLLERDEDTLLEEVADALYQFQSDKVVDAVAPYAIKDNSEIFAISVLANTKTDSAVDALFKSYSVIDEDGKGLVIEALSHQFSNKTFSLIDDYLKHEYDDNGLIDMEQIFYSFYKIFGKEHPDMHLWKSEFDERERLIEESENLSQPISNDTKVGRNEKCPCGSGKKYKKCCGN
ncbi:SEC-C metal-binding domain-containing protein [Lederbergia citrea]|uniref:SEC-C metal-binding domain-containing protein n=1 Tax=Lederbergia citrea TaxID=2833581 RepID=UPI001BC93AB2|nr:SEC-C metal-binding domain-containing protein [Lederbergia citrea]MBS4204963.1 SEC-C domain-containing protein [Lederbergia citrea]